MRRFREPGASWAMIAGATVAGAVIAFADSWRTLVLASAAALAVAATRVRFSGYYAAAALVIVALLVVAGHGLSAGAR